MHTIFLLNSINQAFHSIHKLRTIFVFTNFPKIIKVFFYGVIAQKIGIITNVRTLCLCVVVFFFSIPSSSFKAIRATVDSSPHERCWQIASRTRMTDERVLFSLVFVSTFSQCRP